MHIASSCCEPTYEELKLVSKHYIRTKTTCCEPTYEELKPFPLARKKRANPGLRAYL
jgi:hypothetical protein